LPLRIGQRKRKDKKHQLVVELGSRTPGVRVRAARWSDGRRCLRSGV